MEVKFINFSIYALDGSSLLQIQYQELELFYQAQEIPYCTAYSFSILLYS